MALELILRNARLATAADGAPNVDIGVEAGRIAAIEPALAAEAETVEVGGKLVSAGLVETHIHLDKSRIVDRCAAPAHRARDHMARVSAVKPGFTVEDVYARAKATLEQCLVNGTMLMRTQVEVDPNIDLRGLEALRQLAEDYRWAIDIEFCVFAQEGWTGVPEVDANLTAGLEGGATVVGGAPSFDSDPGGQIRRIFELAGEFDADVDIHLDIGPTTHDMDIHLVCDLAEQHGWGGRVAVGHGTKYSCLALPATDLFVMGLHQDHDVIRGVTDANALVACGVNCSLSTNNVLNPFTPYGDCSLTRIANLYANVVQRGADDDLAECFAMLTERSARLLRREDYGIAVGKPADLVIWDVASPAEAVATVAQPLIGFKRGRRSFTRAPPELHTP